MTLIKCKGLLGPEQESDPTVTEGVIIFFLVPLPQPRGIELGGKVGLITRPQWGREPSKGLK